MEIEATIETHTELTGFTEIGQNGEYIPSENNNSMVKSENFVTLRLKADALKNSPVIHRRSRIEEILSRPEVAAALVNERTPPPKGRPPSPAYPLKQKFTFDEEISEEITEEIDEKVPSSEDSTFSEDSPPNSASSNKEFAIPEEDSDTSSTESKSSASIKSENEKPTLQEDVILPNDELPEDTDETKSPMKLRKKKLFSRFRFSTNRTSTESLEEWLSWERAKARVDEKKKENPLTSNLIPILKEPGTKTPSLQKKTVSFSRLPSESLVKNSADCVALMQNGHHFVKLRSNSRVYNRFYWFDAASNSLHWEPSKKDHMKAKITIPSIKEVRAGKATESFITSDISSHFPEECAFSIIYGEYKNLDLIASSADEANIWITGLRCLLGGKNAGELQYQRDTRDSWLETVFDSADINKDGFLDEHESLELLKSLSDGIRETRIKQKLTELLRFKEDDRTKLTRDEFVEVFKDVTTRPEIYFLLARHATKEDILSVNDLLLFLETEQGIPHIRKEDCLQIINTFEPSSEIRAMPGIGIDGFTKYLMSTECNIFSPKHMKVCQDMNQPLSHYFIAASHNTYLMEDQLNGPCSVSAYVRALLRCCRCIELDCWDGPEDEPIIAHSQHANSSIRFDQAIEAINESAFKNSPYPVILCIENHCNVQQQKKMAETLKNILNSQIYTQPPNEKDDFLPSPDALKYKFLIRGQKLSDEDKDEGEVEEEEEGVELDDNKTPPSPLNKTTSFSLLTKKHENSNNDKPRYHTLIRELSDLVSLCVSRRMGEYVDLEKYHQKCKVNDFTSIHERTASRLVGLHPEELVSHNKKFLSRVYPNGVRIDSTNFNPQDFWNCGMQIASLNYQTPGLMMDINDGRFASNGGCGYVLKPSIMRDEVAYFSAHSNDIIPGISPKTLHLRIISGQEFPKPRGGGAKGHVIDPYVLIELFGMPADCSEQRTRTAHDCGSGLLSAIFDESFEFHLSVPELALVRFVVLDDEFIGDEFIGQYTIPFDCLQSGYRHLRLRSIFDEPLENATLFVQVQVTDTYSIYPLNPSSVAGVQNPGSPGYNSTVSGSKKKPKLKKDQQLQQAKRNRITSIRVVGIQKLDSLFKMVEAPLRESVEMKGRLQHSVMHFKEICGQSALGSIKHCMRMLATRSNNQQNEISQRKLSRKSSSDPAITNTSPSSKNNILPLKIYVDKKTGFPQMEASDVINNESWKKVVLCFNTLVMDAERVLKEANKINEKLTEIQKEVLKHHEDLPALLNIPSITNSSVPTGKKNKKKLGKKLSATTITGEKYHEYNFAWNCSVIRGHSDTIKSAYKEAENTVIDLWESGIDLGMVPEDHVNDFSMSKVSCFNGSNDDSAETSSHDSTESSSLNNDSTEKSNSKTNQNPDSSSLNDSNGTINESALNNKNVNNNNVQVQPLLLTHNDETNELTQTQSDMCRHGNDDKDLPKECNISEQKSITKKVQHKIEPLPVTTL